MRRGAVKRAVGEWGPVLAAGAGLVGILQGVLSLEVGLLVVVASAVVVGWFVVARGRKPEGREAEK